MSKRKQRTPAHLSLEQIREHDLIDISAVCRLIGGTRPVNKATVYRAVAAERLPRPVMVSPNVARWLRPEIELALKQMIAGRRPA